MEYLWCKLLIPTQMKLYYTTLLSVLLFTFHTSLFAQSGQVLNFNGTGSYCSAVTYLSGTDDITLEARVKWAGTTAKNECIVLNGSACCTGYGIYINNANNDSLALKLPGIALLSLHAKLTAGKWQMLTLVRNTGKWQFYVDGVATSFINTTSPNAISAGVDSLLIGADAYNSSFYSGNIDQVVLWGRPLCPGEISARLACQVSPADADLLSLYTFNEGTSGANNTSIISLGDSSGNGNDLTLNYFTLNGATDNFLADAGALNTYCNAYVIPEINSYFFTPICKGTADSLIVQATGSGPFTYNWSNGSKKDTNVVTPATSTVYSLTVTDGFGCTLADTDSVQVFITPVISITGKSPICAGVTDTIKANATGQGLMQYSWSTYDVTSSIAVQPLADSVFKVWVTDTNYCLDSAQIKITVNPSPVLLGMGYSNLSGGVCLGLKDTLYEEVSGAPYTYKWSNGATTDTIIVSPASKTNYTLKVSKGACSQSDSTTVLVFTPPTVNITGVDSICPGTHDTLKTVVNGVKPFQYLWSTYQQQSKIVVDPIVDSTFSVIVTDGNYCTDSAKYTVSMNGPLSTLKMVSTSPNGLCQATNDTIWAKLTGTGPYTYSWNVGLTTDTIIVAPRDTTTYSVLVTEPGGCFAKDSVTAIIHKHLIKIIGAATGYTGSTDTLIGRYGSQFMWPDSVQGDTDFIVSKNVTDTTFMLTGINSYGCPDTAYFTVHVLLTGINSLPLEGSTMLAYPNPSTTVLNLEFEMNGVAKNAVIQIVDMTGREIMHYSAVITDKKVLPINVSNLPVGSYFVRVTTTDGVQQVLRFIKE